jgi:AraC-like DNA-binding protein
LPPAATLLRISTEMFPERDRFAAFREEFVRKVLTMDIVDHSGGRPRADLTLLSLGPAMVAALVCTPAEFIRNKHHVKDGSDDFILEIIETGPIQIDHVGEQHICDRGWGHFADHGRPRRGFGPCGGSVRNVSVRAAALRSLVAHAEDRAGHLVRPGPAWHLLDGYLRSLVSLERAPSAELGAMIGVHLLDLVAAVLGPTTEARELIAGRGLKAARLQALLAEIARRFSNPALDLDDVARHFSLSRRYLQRLLEETGKSFTEHVTERRLQRAYAMLADRRFAHMRIIDIALAVGFGDISHFNRMFRRRFGDSPSGVRGAGHDS